MKKKIYALTLATLLATSMSAFAGADTKSCNKTDAKTCEIKDPDCKDSEQCDKTKCEKKCEKKCDTKCEKNAS